ncbi:MAG TPA: hypothetical protein VHG08_02790 [Longimicrobium sp.]|nr:hypothetical protein [Longimicrobium sp.]
MTAEIALLNKEAVALAADSAVTIQTEGGVKILPSANKIFTLSKYFPVGVMVYGNAQLMDVPWELLVKSYRKQLGTKYFPRLEDYARDLLRFLSESPAFFPEEAQNEYILAVAQAIFGSVVEAIVQAVGAIIAEKGQVTETEVIGVEDEVIGQAHEGWEKFELAEGLAEEFVTHLKEKHFEALNALIEEVFEDLPLSGIHRDQLLDLAIWVTCKFAKQPRPGEAGIVVAGYGENDVYPSIRSYRVAAVIENHLLYTKDRHHDVSTGGAVVVPFAQSEMVYTFMEGVEPYYQSTIENELEDVLKQFADTAAKGCGLQGKARQEFRKKLQAFSEQVRQNFRTKSKQYRREHFALPAISVTAVLPKDELAAMAESLVNLTFFRRRMSMAAETVGGPVDVAVISKGDGFIWIKRKHYFSKELNPHFVNNYFREAP